MKRLAAKAIPWLPYGDLISTPMDSISWSNVNVKLVRAIRAPKDKVPAEQQYLADGHHAWNKEAHGFPPDCAKR